MDHEYQDIETGKKRLSGKAKAAIILVLILVVLAIIVGIVVGLTVGKKVDPIPPPFELDAQIVIGNLMGHLQDLENIAMKFSGSRAVEFGYNASVDYVLEQLNSLSYFDVHTELFTLPIYKVLVPAGLSQMTPNVEQYQAGVDFGTFSGFSGDVNVTAPVFVAHNLGCNASDFQGFTNGDIALIKRGICTFEQKAINARDAGAAAILIFNDGTAPDRTGIINGNLGTTQFHIPIFGLTFEIGEFFGELATSLNKTFTLNVIESAIEYTATTMNVIADTKWGNPKSVIVVGSHLDSVPAGPGINDNGSGTSANLEMAIQLAKSGVTFPNKIRFAWWGAEERGLLGSEAYVANLNATNPQELNNIALNLNFDMLGSPNYFVGLYNGSQAKTLYPSIRPGSENIQSLFEEYLDAEEQAYQLTSFDGRSDYGPFIAANIPAGGLFTGAEGIKTPEQRKLYGGIANAAYDPCYHQACDTVENINPTIYELMAKTAAFVLQTLASQNDLGGFLAKQ